MINKYSSLGLAPPTNTDELPEKQTQVTSLRDALNLKGKKEQIEGKAHFKHDQSLLESEEYLEVVEKLKNVDEKIKRCFTAI